MTELDKEVADRCEGSPTGGPDCLIIDEEPERLAQGLRDACWVGDFSLSHPDQPPVGPNGQVARGTTVTVQTACIPVFGDLTGKPLSAFDAELGKRCDQAVVNTAGCLLVTELPEPVPSSQRSTCTVEALSYEPAGNRVTANGKSVLKRGTTVRVEIACPVADGG